MKSTTCRVTIEGISPLSQGRYHNEPKLEGETHDEAEKRTWRERLHYDDRGNVFIPPMAFKNALTAAAQYIGKKIPGEGNKKYTKKFESGLAIFEPVFLGVKKDEVKPNALFVPSDGKRGGSKRVMKYFPIIHNWGGELVIEILDPILGEAIMEEHLETAGFMIGVGVFRPANNGYFGRFKIVKMEADWSKQAKQRS